MPKLSANSHKLVANWHNGKSKNNYPADKRKNKRKMKPSTNVDTAYHTARPAKTDTQTTAQLSTHASPACSTDLQALTKEIRTSNLASEYRL